MKRSNRKRHRPAEVVAKLWQANAALAKGAPLARCSEVAGRFRGDAAPLAGGVRGGGPGCGTPAEGAGDGERPAEAQVADQQLDIQILKEISKGEF